MAELLVRTVDGGEHRGKSEHGVEKFIGDLVAAGHTTILVTYTAQGRDPKDRVTTFFRDGVVSVSEL